MKLDKRWRKSQNTCMKCSNYMPKKGACKCQKGFTLVEVMVAMALFGILSVTLFGGILYSLNLVRATRENTQATQLMVEKTECVRLVSWNQLVHSNSWPQTFTTELQGVSFNGTMTLTPAVSGPDYSTNIKCFTVSLTWTNGKTIQQRDMETFIAKEGNWNYVSH